MKHLVKIIAQKIGNVFFLYKVKTCLNILIPRCRNGLMIALGLFLKEKIHFQYF